MEWNKDNIDEIIVKINSMLADGMTMADIERNEFNVNASVIIKRLGRMGYKRVNNQYILPSNKSKKDNVRQCVLQEVGQVKIIQNDELEVFINQQNNMKKLKGLIDRYDEIVSFLDKLSPSTVNSNIIIELPIEEGKKDFRATARVNKLVWEQFSEFCNEHKQYSKKDLLSQALIEFIRNHS